jgi:hypothetical protein
MSQTLHIVYDEDRTLCGTRKRTETGRRWGWSRAGLDMVLKGTSIWTARPSSYKRCKKCAKKLVKEHPEVLLIDLKKVVL